MTGRLHFLDASYVIVCIFISNSFQHRYVYLQQRFHGVVYMTKLRFCYAKVLHNNQNTLEACFKRTLIVVLDVFFGPPAYKYLNKGLDFKVSVLNFLKAELFVATYYIGPKFWFEFLSINVK